MYFLDREYISRVSYRLDRFKVKNHSPYLANFRCPYCGDSQKNLSKTRGFIYTRDNDLWYSCRNCNINRSAKQFIKYIDPDLYKEYQKDYLYYQTGEKKRDFDLSPVISLEPNSSSNDIFRDLQKISDLRKDHPARKYMEFRKIPEKHLGDIFFCPDFREFTNSLIPNKFSGDWEEERILIPFRDIKGNIVGYQGRALPGKDGIRYISIMLDNTKDKIWGIDKIDTKMQIYVFEGPFDAMFIDNSLAMAGSSASLSGIHVESKYITKVYDNEPRNKDIVKAVEKSINMGYSVCLWPYTWKYKDINDAVMDGISPDQIKRIIDVNTTQGMMASLKFGEWKRC